MGLRNRFVNLRNAWLNPAATRVASVGAEAIAGATNAQGAEPGIPCAADRGNAERIQYLSHLPWTPPEPGARALQGRNSTSALRSMRPPSTPMSKFLPPS